MTYKVITDHPIAWDSNDHLAGGDQANTMQNEYVFELVNHMGRKFSILDIGCAAGGHVMEFAKLGNEAVGIDGSDQYANANLGSWPEFHNLNLFTCDAGFPFTITKDGEPAKFDVISTWECLEHIPVERIPQLLRNMHSLLKDDGFIIASVSTMSDGGFRHVNIREKSEWYKSFEEYFDIHEYPFKEKFRDLDTSFYVILKKKVEK